ncbi:conserved hypothetical protein [Talaromyces stipitatus ATCC 10500]|uniref:Cupin 2 conserved barrel domain-containing protein n=1 Tax=Talaromyces stipitatus (strain ATCC 10500 / CBS 375.48 / QM 6759 / NRRL 1006) TaxID=441959 RepID=B8MSG9_TALSN|nr:uncharacterized protein TSTA_000710 [Talaromyces stipitatus ATCC 10500]EED11997.1 conserved hypothetical protein [Talaromyces stipitatus ATCC 10500]
MATKADRVIVAFNGAIETHIFNESIDPPRAFAFEVIFYPHLWPATLLTKKPPMHFHPFQKEYIQVLAGRLCVEQSGQVRTLTPTDGEVCIKPWVNHRLYPSDDDLLRAAEDGRGDPVRFLIAGQETNKVFRLDTIFFENWYGYQDEILTEKQLDLVQVLTMFDAGGSYLSLPWWIPFGRTLSMSIGIVVGRWIGPLLGYQPYYPKWTSDWELACEKMRQSFFQRRFAERKDT